MKNTSLLSKSRILITICFVCSSFYSLHLTAQCSAENSSMHATAQLFFPDEACGASDPYYQIEMELFNNNLRGACRNQEIWIDEIEIIASNPADGSSYVIRDPQVYDISDGLPGFPFAPTPWSAKKTVTTWGYIASANLQRDPGAKLDIEAQIVGRIVSNSGAISSENFTLNFPINSIERITTSACEFTTDASAQKLGNFSQSAFLHANWHPNPAQAHAVISFEAQAGNEVNIQLLNIQGQVIRTLKQEEVPPSGRYKRKIEISNLAPGMYYTRIYSGAESHIIKWVKFD